MVARHVTSQVGDEMAQVVFLLCSDGAVGQEYAHVASGETADGMVDVNPCVHTFT